MLLARILRLSRLAASRVCSRNAREANVLRWRVTPTLTGTCPWRAGSCSSPSRCVRCSRTSVRDLRLIPTLALCCGSAIYLVAFVGLRWRVSRALGRGRPIARGGRLHAPDARPDVRVRPPGTRTRHGGVALPARLRADWWREERAPADVRPLVARLPSEPPLPRGLCSRLTARIAGSWSPSRSCLSVALAGPYRSGCLAKRSRLTRGPSRMERGSDGWPGCLERTVPATYVASMAGLLAQYIG